MTDNNDKQIEKSSNESTDIIKTGEGKVFDLTGLPEETKTELRKQYLEKSIELQAKAIELGLDARAIKQRLSDSTDVVAEATKDSSHATITTTYEDKMGRTEAIIGNTDRAAKGKLDRSQKGQQDYTLLYVIGGIVLIILVVILAT